MMCFGLAGVDGVGFYFFRYVGRCLDLLKVLRILFRILEKRLETCHYDTASCCGRNYIMYLSMEVHQVDVKGSLLRCVHGWSRRCALME